MQDINIEKVANGYLVKIYGDYDEIDEEVFLYKTRLEMETDLVRVIVRAHELYGEIQAKKAAKKG